MNQENDQELKRTSIKITHEAHEKLLEISKQFKLNIGETVEVLINNLGKPEDAVLEDLRERRSEKVNSRNSPWAIYVRERDAKRAAQGK